MSKLVTSVGSRPVGRRTMALALLFIALGSTALGRGQSPAPQANLPTITYRRVFQGSMPEFVEIAVRQDGAAKADVRQLSETAAPQDFEVGPAIRSTIFDLTRELRNFKGADLDVHRRIAYLGQKTFRWEQGAEAYQTQYNYTLDAKASQLQKIFESLAQQQADLATLEQALRYDRLGVNDALNQFEDHVTQRALAEPERFLPVLDRIAEDARLIDLARQRARSLAARIRVAQSR